jgi:hypothetical protein
VCAALLPRAVKDAWRPVIDGVDGILVALGTKEVLTAAQTAPVRVDDATRIPCWRTARLRCA